MNNKAHLRQKDFDSNGDIIPMACKEEKGDLISREGLNKTIDDITWYHINPHGELVEGAFDDGDALYKAEDIYKAIDNASTVEPEKALIANVTFDEDKLKDIVQAEVIDKIKSGELVLKDERPQGEWIADNLHNTICNKCGGIRRDNRVDYIAFCNKCGADMRKEDKK